MKQSHGAAPRTRETARRRRADRPLVAVSRLAGSRFRARNISTPGAGNCWPATAWCFAICWRARRSAPSWQDLVGTLRRMELRGEVRGGRFVSHVSGEQYALTDGDRAAAPSATSRGGDQPWIVISAADPLNLFGVITPGPRIPATHRNALVVQDGRLVASRIAGVAEFHEPLDEATQWAMRKAMTTGRRVPIELEGERTLLSRGT